MRRERGAAAPLLPRESTSPFLQSAQKRDKIRFLLMREDKSKALFVKMHGI